MAKQSTDCNVVLLAKAAPELSIIYDESLGSFKLLPNHGPLRSKIFRLPDFGGLGSTCCSEMCSFACRVRRQGVVAADGDVISPDEADEALSLATKARIILGASVLLWALIGFSLFGFLAG